MNDLTQVLQAAGSGDPKAGAALVPLVCDELRQLARYRLSNESNEHTLQPTALVHCQAVVELRPLLAPGGNREGQ